MYRGGGVPFWAVFAAPGEDRQGKAGQGRPTGEAAQLATAARTSRQIFPIYIGGGQSGRDKITPYRAGKRAKWPSKHLGTSAPVPPLPHEWPGIRTGQGRTDETPNFTLYI